MAQRKSEGAARWPPFSFSEVTTADLVASWLLTYSGTGAAKAGTLRRLKLVAGDLMHCREFRDKHVAFVDDLLPAFEMDAMRQHLIICSGCARQDIKVRRSLLLVRNLPPVEVSPDFMQRLNLRLAEVGSVPRNDFVATRSFPSFVSVAALAAGVAAVAYLAVETNNYFAHPDDFATEATPIVAAASVPDPEPVTAPISSAALVAAVPTGIPVWPTVLMVGQTPMRLASMGFDDEQAR